MVDFIVIAIVVILVGAAIAYIVRAKRRGVKCVGCPAGGTCSCHTTESTSPTSSPTCDCDCGCNKQ